MEWLRRYLSGRGFRLHPIQFDSTAAGYFRPWHIDVILTLVRPGLALLCPDKPIITPGIEDMFKKNDWEIVLAARPEYELSSETTTGMSPPPIAATMW